jgi:hypothetical protein
MDIRQSLTKPELPANLRLEFLTPDQVIRIDKTLATVGEYGEVHLIIQKGELRYINRVESYKAWNDKQK